jgi:hypothetical protein
MMYATYAWFDLGLPGGFDQVSLQTKLNDDKSPTGKQPTNVLLRAQHSNVEE